MFTFIWIIIYYLYMRFFQINNIYKTTITYPIENYYFDENEIILKFEKNIHFFSDQKLYINKRFIDKGIIYYLTNFETSTINLINNNGVGGIYFGTILNYIIYDFDFDSKNQILKTNNFEKIPICSFT